MFIMDLFIKYFIHTGARLKKKYIFYMYNAANLLFSGEAKVSARSWSTLFADSSPPPPPPPKKKKKKKKNCDKF